MPEGVTETLWNKAKSTFVEQMGREPTSSEDYAIIMTIYKDMGGSIKAGDLSFQSEEFSWSEATIKGEKRYYVEGFVSTADEDDSGEVVDAQDDIYEQIKGQKITLDLEHDEWFEEEGGVVNPDNAGKQLHKPKQSTIPVGKIIDAKIKNHPISGKKGVWVKAEVNKNLGKKFKTIWNSITDGFLHSFSIAFFPIESISRQIDGAIKTTTKKLALNNITLTGNPVNKLAMFSPVMKAALKTEGEKKMTEQSKVEQPIQTKVEQPAEQKPAEPKTEQPAEPKTEQPAEQKTEQPAEPKVDVLEEAKKIYAKIEESNKKLTEQQEKIAEQQKEFREQQEKFMKDLKEISGEPSAPVDRQEPDAQENKEYQSPLGIIKARFKENERLKAKLREPVIKGVFTSKTPDMPKTREDLSPLQQIQ